MYKRQHCESQFYTEGWRKNLAKTIKANVSIPVIGTNTIKHPQTAEALLQEGVSDYVGVLRSQIADPQWGIKAKEGKEDMIRPCIGCLDCMLKDGMGLPVTCPDVYKRQLYKGVKQKSLAVVEDRKLQFRSPFFSRVIRSL